MFRAEPTPRLVPSPVFLLSTPRSGSTLLRNILGTHSQVHATTELVLTEVGVQFARYPSEYNMNTIYAELGFGAVGLTGSELEYLLWDRILHRELARSGKQVLFHKAPRVLLRWRRIAECWPQARYIFLLRHPMNILRSSQQTIFAGMQPSYSELTDVYLRFLYLLREARAELPGLTVRYEELTAEPARVCRGICEYLGLSWEPAMVEYGSGGRYSVGAGDISERLAAGRPVAGRPLPAEDEIPLMFRPICVALGYRGGAVQADGGVQADVNGGHAGTDRIGAGDHQVTGSS